MQFVNLQLATKVNVRAGKFQSSDDLDRRFRSFLLSEPAVIYRIVCVQRWLVFAWRYRPAGLNMSVKIGKEAAFQSRPGRTQLALCDPSRSRTRAHTATNIFCSNRTARLILTAASRDDDAALVWSSGLTLDRHNMLTIIHHCWQLILQPYRQWRASVRMLTLRSDISLAMIPAVSRLTTGNDSKLPPLLITTTNPRGKTAPLSQMTLWDRSQAKVFSCMYYYIIAGFVRHLF